MAGLGHIREKKSAMQQTYVNQSNLKRNLKYRDNKTLEIREMSSILFMEHYKKFYNKSKPIVT